MDGLNVGAFSSKKNNLQLLRADGYQSYCCTVPEYHEGIDVTPGASNCQVMHTLTH